MTYKIITIGLIFLSSFFFNGLLVSQSIADYLLADNLQAYSSGSFSEDKGLPYSLDFADVKNNEEEVLFAEGFSETNLVVRKGKRKGKGEYSFRINLEYDLPERVISGSTFLFKCKITKGDIKGLAKLTQRLPIGFDIVESVIGDAKTKYLNYTLNLLWDQVTNDSIIEVSYNVVVNRSYGYLPISSILYFEETGKKYLFNTHVLVEKDQPAEDLIVYKPPEKEVNTNVNKPNSDIENKTKPVVKANVAPTHRPIVVSPTSTTINKNTDIDGISYSIQILALMYNNIKPENLNNKYHITENITVEKYPNWRKYTVGKFSSITEAKAFLTTIKNKGLTDAFIVGYEDGYRFLIK